jgi:hypothetical protein
LQGFQLLILRQCQQLPCMRNSLSINMAAVLVSHMHVYPDKPKPVEQMQRAHV